MTALLLNLSDDGEIESWLANERAVPAQLDEAVAAAAEIVELLSSVQSEALTRAWFVGKNPDLGFEAPALCFSSGDWKSVEHAARNLISQG